MAARQVNIFGPFREPGSDFPELFFLVFGRMFIKPPHCAVLHEVHECIAPQVLSGRQGDDLIVGTVLLDRNGRFRGKARRYNRRHGHVSLVDRVKDAAEHLVIIGKRRSTSLEWFEMLLRLYATCAKRKKHGAQSDGWSQLAQLADPGAPTLIRQDEKSAALYVLMPMRV